MLNQPMIFSQNSFSCSIWRLWEITRFRGSEDRPESGGPPLKVHGVSGCQGSSASEPLHEWALLDSLPHEEQCSATRLHTHSTSWYQKLHFTAVPNYSGEKTIQDSDVIHDANRLPLNLWVICVFNADLHTTET